MSNVIKIRAHIKLVPSDIGRKTPFATGYRPLFSFKDAPTRISGKIDLLDKDLFEPNSEGDVIITFLQGTIDDKYFKENEKFDFTEGLHPIGNGEILEIL